MDETRDRLLRSLEALRAQLERHERMVRGEAPPGAVSGDCRTEECRHRRRLCRFLLETAGILDRTRKAFKSKQLEDLRKECLRLLAEEFERGGQDVRRGATGSRDAVATETTAG